MSPPDRSKRRATRLPRWQTALADAPSRLLLLTHLAASRIALKSSDLAKAAAALDLARTYAPESCDAFERLEIAEVEAELALARNEPQIASELLGRTIARHAEDDLASREVQARLVHAKALEALGRADEAERTLGAALRRALARGLSGYADEVRSRLATGHGGHTRVADLPATADTDADRRFVRQRPLGSGAFGKVMRAYDLELGFEVAIKRAARGAHYDPATRNRLLEIARTEVAAASRLDHPGIARVFGLLTSGGDTLVIEEFVEGPTLRSAMEGGLELPRKLDLLAHIAYALAAVHGAGVIHRDLKPDNIILRGGEAPVLIDFGVAMLSGKRDELDAGTPAYMAPEQARGGKADARTDLYALGVIACEMLTGQRPEPPRPRSRIRAALVQSGIDPAIAKLIGQLIAPYKILRPRSAAAVGNVFANAAKDSRASPRAPAPPTAAPRRARRAARCRTRCGSARRGCPTSGPAKCAVSTTLSRLNSGLFEGGGSWSNTSRPAPKILPAARCAVSAFSSITGPREVLMMIAFGFISSSSSLPIMWRVESFSGTCSDTTSEDFSNSRSRRNFTLCRSASPFGEARDVEILHMHAERLRQPRDLLADGAESDDAERLVVQLVHARRRPVAAPAPARHAAVLPDHFARHREHQHDGVLGHRDRVCAAVVGERHLRAPRGFEIDVVVAGAEQAARA